MTVTLLVFAIAIVLSKLVKVIKKSKQCTVVTPQYTWSTEEYLDKYGIDNQQGFVILYKRVSKDWKTQEGTENETIWAIGERLIHQNWQPETSECGEYKFHACATPFFCDQFRTTIGDRYIAVKIKVKDLYAWKNPTYPTKIAFRAGTVLYECDSNGNQITTK